MYANKVLIAIAFAAGRVSANDLSPCQAVGTASLRPSPGEEWGRSLLVMLRLLLLEWNAKSGCAVASIILASDGNAYIPGRMRPPWHTRL